MSPDFWQIAAIISACVLALHCLVANLVSARSVAVRGRLPLCRVAAAGIALAFLAALFPAARREWPFAAAWAVVLACYIFTPVGIGARGFYRGGVCVPFSRVEYYMVIREFRGGFTLRVHSRDGKDFIALFRDRDRDRVAGLFAASGVRDWDSFRWE